MEPKDLAKQFSEMLGSPAWKYLHDEWQKAYLDKVASLAKCKSGDFLDWARSVARIQGELDGMSFATSYVPKKTLEDLIKKSNG
jgi:hypothetical protein